MHRRRPITLASRAGDCPLAPGVYRLYRGRRLLHVGMAAGAATLRSEVLSHARGHYGPHTQRATRVRWEVAPDGLAAHRRFLTLYAQATYHPRADASRRRLSASRYVGATVEATLRQA
jgi:hypothetical protein